VISYRVAVAAMLDEANLATRTEGVASLAAEV